MHERKRTMFERADGFVALPGGIGTLEEVVEQLTWAQLGRHKKPILIANIDGYWDPLLTLIEHMREQEFVPPALRVDFLVANRVEDILPKTAQCRARRGRRRKRWRCRPSGCERHPEVLGAQRRASKGDGPGA